MSNIKRSSNDHHQQQENKGNKEEFDTNLESDSGFLSGALHSEPLSEIIDTVEPKEVPKVQLDKTQEKQKTEEVMDFDSGAIVSSQDLTESMCNLKLHQNPEMKNNEVYFQVNEDGDT